MSVDAPANATARQEGKEDTVKRLSYKAINFKLLTLASLIYLCACLIVGGVWKMLWGR